MRKGLLILALIAVVALGLGTTRWLDAPPSEVSTDAGVRLAVETVVGDLDTVWDMAWSPDGSLWITERGGRVSRVDVAAGSIEVIGALEVEEAGEAGLMGMALHPDFPATPWVYAAHSYATAAGVRNRLVRMTFEGGRLGAPETLVDAMPGRRNHDGARLAFGPDGMLYLTMGDAGRARLAQDRTSLGGKILRLTDDGGAAPGNPFGDRIWSWGHRNPQGLAFQPGTGVLYSAEHGPSTDDEINVIEAGANYGWPDVVGFCDRAGERDACERLEAVEPVHAWTPTVGIAGIDFYDSDAMPGWRGSLLAVALRGTSMYRIELRADGRRSTFAERLFDDEFGRLRDVLVGPDGAVYLATSNRDGRGLPAMRDDRILRLTVMP